MLVLETHFGDLKFRSAPLKPPVWSVPSTFGPLSYYPTTYDGASYNTKAFSVDQVGYYYIYMECMYGPAGGRIQCYTATDNSLKSTTNTYDVMNYPTVVYLGGFYADQPRKEKLIFNVVTKDTNAVTGVIIGGKITVEFSENLFR